MAYSQKIAAGCWLSVIDNERLTTFKPFVASVVLKHCVYTSVFYSGAYRF